MSDVVIISGIISLDGWLYNQNVPEEEEELIMKTSDSDAISDSSLKTCLHSQANLLKGKVSNTSQSKIWASEH